MKKLLLLFLISVPVISKSQDLKLNEREYFERQSINVLVFSNNFNGGFNDEKNSGIEIIHHGVRTIQGVVPNRCSMVITVPISLQSQEMLLQDCCSASLITLRTLMTGHSFGAKTRALLLEIPSM